MTEKPEYILKDLMIARGLKLATAESCTGGLVGHRITNVAGSSDYYLGGAIAYAYEAKEQMLGVRKDTLLEFGAVSQETVLEMACGIRSRLNADISVSISGIAGPGGGMPHKPVGTVWFGFCAPQGAWAHVYQFQGDREQVKAASAEEALQAIVRYLEIGEPWKNSQVV